MAVALLTTFYGAVLANAFALPLKNKISYRSGREVLKMNIIIAGTLGIVAGEKSKTDQREVVSIFTTLGKSV